MIITRLIFVIVLLTLNFKTMTLANAPHPQVLIITTGGTIANVKGSEMLDGHALIKSIPDLAKYAHIEVLEFSRIGSSKIEPSHWLALGQIINKKLGEGKYSGIVITHGTDTMEETAYFLHLTVKSNLPVVLTGSMRSSDQTSSDGPANLIAAVRVAARSESSGHGVLIVMNDMISTARDTWKTDDLRVHSFQSPQFGHLGVVDPDTVTFYRKILRRHTATSEFDIAEIAQLPRVDLISDFTGLTNDVLDCLADLPSDGIVVQSFAGGRTSATVRQYIEQGYMQKPIVLTSRVPSGRIPFADHHQRSIVISTDLPANKARILLMLSLTVTNKIDGIRSLFSIY